MPFPTRIVPIVILVHCALAPACLLPDSEQSFLDGGARPAGDVAAAADDQPIVRPLPPDPPPPPERRRPEPPPDAGPAAGPEQPVTGATDSATRKVTTDPVLRSYLSSATTPTPPAAPPRPQVRP